MNSYLDENGLLYLWAKIKDLLTTRLNTKQDVINDLATIRSLASSGAQFISSAAHSISNSDITAWNNKVNNTTTVNGHVLNSNITLAKGDVGLSNVTNDAQVKRSEMGSANGVATLDGNGKIPSGQLPSYVDDIIEAYAISGQTALSLNWLATEKNSEIAIIPEAGKIYVLMETSGDYAANTQFRWSGSAYVRINDGGLSPITNSEIDTIIAS